MTIKRQRPRGGDPGGVDSGLRHDYPTATLREDLSTDCPPEAAESPSGTIPLAAVLSKLADELPALRVALDRQADRPRIEPLTLRLDEVADSLGLSRRAIERERSAGRFPAADLHVGRVPLWRVQTVRAWVERGGCPL